MSGRLFGYARVSVASDTDANNFENLCRLLGDCAQVFEDVGSGASWKRPGLNRPKTALAHGDCVKVTALDHLGRFQFQSSSGLLAGCNTLVYPMSQSSSNRFQSSSGLLAGCNADVIVVVAGSCPVSILIRPEGRMQPPP